MSPELLLLAALWIGYCVLHSLLALPWAKQRFAIGKSYRLAYTLISVIGLLGILLFQATLPAPKYFESTELTKIVGLSFGMVGIQLVRMSFKKVSVRVFLGLQNEVAEELVVTGIYSRIRHPLYTATLLLGIGFFIFYPTNSIIVMMVVWVVYLPIGILLEEKKLTEQYGSSYTKYKQEVPALFPRIF